MPLLRLQAKPLTYSTIAIVVACCPAPAYCHYHLNASITVVQCDLYSLVLLCFLAGLSFFYPDAAPEVVEKPGDSSLSKLKALYTHAKDLSESEVNFSTLLIGQLDTLLPSGPSGQQRRRIEGNDQKRRKMKTDSDISRISPNVRSQLEAWASLKGEQVAARVTPDESEDDEWFVVKVIHFDKETKEGRRMTSQVI